MGKKNISDSFNLHRTTKKKVLNPFEIHVNKQKFNVLGRKIKSEKGLPGVSRAKAIKKRKATLLQEYRVKGKSNKFMDMRIGERNSAMTAEDKIVARFTAERMRSHKRNSIFNLADEEVLTHHGQTLNEIENFDDPRSDEEDVEDSGKLEAGFVGDAHFGGGVLTKTSSDGASSRKNLIDQLIAESKKRKADQQRAREHTLELTEKLDSEWKDLLPLVSTSKKRAGDVQESLKPDAYDTVMRQLKMEARGKPSDKLKTEEELAVEERERLERLEAERQRRMQGVVDEASAITPASGKHRSADDLDDGFELQTNAEPTVIYDDEGKLVGPASSFAVDASTQKPVDLDDNTGNTEGQEEDENDEDEEESVEESESDEEMERNDDMDSLSDLKGNDSDREDEDASDNKEELREVETLQTTTHTQVKHQSEVKADLLARKQLMDKARQELPYTFQVPDSYEGLQKLVAGRGPEHQAVILERMVKCSHPSLAQGNKEKLGTLFAYLLQHLDDTATTFQDGRVDCFSVLDRLAPHIYDIAHFDPPNAHHCILEVLKEKYEDFRKQPRVFPGTDTLVFLKLVSLLFPTSDFRHQVVTPALVFMEHMLHTCRVRVETDIAVGLLVCTLMLEFTDLSKRFSPMTLAFLQDVLWQAVPTQGSQQTGKIAGLLILSENMSEDDSLGEELMHTADLRGVASRDERFKVRTLHTAVRLARELCVQLESLPGCHEALGQCRPPLARLPLDMYPPVVRKAAEQLRSSLDALALTRFQMLVLDKKKPKALRLYEPNIQQVFDVKRRRPMGAARQEREKLVHKFKREMKGAMREIRRDRTFLAKLKLKETARSDHERLQKVKEIYGSAAAQQSELKKLKKK